jgi:hypothetical protein
MQHGQDARAAFFYITDYITKSELSSYESLSLIKLALDKVDKDEYSRKPNIKLTKSEDNARRRIRIFTSDLPRDSSLQSAYRGGDDVR